MRRIARLTAPVAVLAAALACAAPAGATSGEITRAEASADWTAGSIAGSVTWTGCERELDEPLIGPLPPPEYPGAPEPPPPEPTELPPCGWIPFATVGPSSNPAECSTDGRLSLSSLASDVVLAWIGPHREETGTATFDVAGVALHGGPPQLLCLSVIEFAPEYAECPPPLPDYRCGYVAAQFSHALASATLTALPGQPSPPIRNESEQAPPETQDDYTKPARRVVHHRRHGHVRKK